MIIDWTTNLWLDEHMSATGFRGMRKGHARPDAGPDAHRAAVADHVDHFLVTALAFPRLGLEVPNDFVARYVRESGGKGIGLACVDPNRPDAPQELERAVKTLGLRALKLAPTYQDFDPLGPAAWQIYELADHLRIPIYWHQAAASHPLSILKYGDPTALDEIGLRLPDLVMVLEHFGMPWTGVTIELLHKHANFYADVSARLHRTWEMYEALHRAIDHGVAHKILFGSDFPVMSVPQALDALRAYAEPRAGFAPIDGEVIEDIINNRPLSLLWPGDAA